MPDRCVEYVVDNRAEIIDAEKLGLKDVFAYGLGVYDSFLVVFNRNPQNLFVVYNLESDSIVARFGKIGHSNNEFLNSGQKCYFRKSKSDVLMYVSDNGMMTKCVNISKSMRDEKCTVEKKIKYDVIPCLFVGYDENNSLTRVSITYDDPRDKIYYPPKYIVKCEGDDNEMNIYPTILDNNNRTVLEIAYCSTLDISPDFAYIVDANTYVNQFNIIDWRKNVVVGVREKNAYSIGDLKRQESPDYLAKMLHVYNKDVTLSDAFIFLLQDLRSWEDNEAGKDYTPRICVLNYEGEFLTSFFVKEDLLKIAFDSLRNCIYGVDQNGCVYRYDIDKIIKNY